jgi:hypothetical protein
MDNYKILVKLPTKFRKEKFFTTLDIFYKMCSDLENTFFLITIDDDDDVMNSEEVSKKMKSYKNLNFYSGYSKSKLSATNRDLEKFTDWDIMVLASDDTIPVLNGWDQDIRENMKTFFSDTDGVLWYNDGFQGNRLNTLPILGKKYFDRFGYVQYPEYKSCFADNEFMEVSKILNKYKYIDKTIIQHQHPDWGFGQKDYAHDENVKNFNYDSNLFNERKKINFNL